MAAPVSAEATHLIEFAIQLLPDAAAALSAAAMVPPLGVLVCLNASAKAAAHKVPLVRPAVDRHPEVLAKRGVSKDDRPGPGHRPPIPGLPEIGTIARKSATADLQWLASRALQGDGNESVLDTV
jgi:hypothetical protein